MRPTRFRLRTQVSLVTVIGLIAGLVAGTAAALVSLRRLSDDASTTASTALSRATEDYLRAKVEATSRQVNDYISGVVAELEHTAKVGQDLMARASAAPIGADERAAVEAAMVAVNHPGGNRWYQRRAPGRCELAVWSEEFDAGGRIRGEVLEEIHGVADVEMQLAAVSTSPLRKQWTYVVGPREATYLHVCPADPTFLSHFAEDFPGADQQDWYTYFFPKLYETWEAWAQADGDAAARAQQVVVTAPYVDAAGAGHMVTFFRPLWRADRVAGTVGVDLTLAQIAEFIQSVRIARTGFGFVVQPDGNILAIDARSQERLGIPVRSNAGPGVTIVERRLSDSTEADIASLDLGVGTDDVAFRSITLGGIAHTVVVARLTTLQGWTSGVVGTSDQVWILAFVVPSEELVGAVAATRLAIERKGEALVGTQVAVAVGTFLVVLLGVWLVSSRVTRRLGALERRARSYLKQDEPEQARGEPAAGNEVDALTAAFDAMLARVDARTSTLEDAVAARTRELEVANQVVERLNERLRAENSRLSAEQARMSQELEIAATIQGAMLPTLATHDELEFAGRVEPADEVGGDFYNVLPARADGATWIAIGDVSGHGLGAGLTMMITQAALASIHESAPTCASADVLRHLNRLLHESSVRLMGGKRHVTCQLLIYRGDGRFECAGAHLWPLVYRAATDAIEQVEIAGPWLGVLPELPSVPVQTITLEPGDVMALYSDGIVEAADAKGGCFDVVRVERVMRENLRRQDSMERCADALMRAVREHAARQDDDRTLLLVRRRPEGAA